MKAATPLKMTAMHHAQLALGARLVERDGWQAPEVYTSVGEEVEMVRGAGGICDISPVGKLDVQGTEALAGLNKILGLSKPLNVGRAVSVEIKLEDGVIRRATAVGLACDEVLILTQPGEAASISRQLEGELAGCAHLVDVTSAWAGVAIVGPQSYRVLSKLAELDLDPLVFPDRGCVQGKAAEVHVIIVRSDIGGALGYQLFVTRDFGEYIWNALLHAGRSDGVGPVGTKALDEIKGV